MSRAVGGGLPGLLVPLTKPEQPASARLHAASKITAMDCRLRPAHFDECVKLIFIFFLVLARPGGRASGRIPHALRAYWVYLSYVTGRRTQKRVVVLMEARPVAGAQFGEVKDTKEQVKNGCRTGL